MHNLRKNMHIEHLLQLGIFFLPLFRSLGIRQFHIAVLLFPPMEGLLRDLMLSVDGLSRFTALLHESLAPSLMMARLRFQVSIL